MKRSKENPTGPKGIEMPDDVDAEVVDAVEAMDKVEAMAQEEVDMKANTQYGKPSLPVETNQEKGISEAGNSIGVTTISVGSNITQTIATLPRNRMQATTKMKT